MIRLEKHEELVDRVFDAIDRAFARQCPSLAYEASKAALDALLAAVVEKGVGREGRVVVDRGEWWGGTSHPPHSFSDPALILKLESKP
jgi:hypothetical protein